MSCECRSARAGGFSHSDRSSAAPGWWRIGLGALIAGNSMAVALATNLSELAASVRLFLGSMLLLAALATLALLGHPLVGATAIALRQRRISVELLFSCGVVGALVASTVSLARGSGDLYYEVVSILLLIYALATRVRGDAQRRALEAGRVLDFGIATGQVERSGGVQTLPVEQIACGDIVRVRPGERIPVDGTLLSQSVFVCESEMTGEPPMAVRRAGDPVWAGTRAIDALVRLRTTAVAGDRRIDRLAQHVVEASGRPSAVERQVDHLARVLVPVVITVSIATFGAWAWLSTWDQALFNAMAVLLVACPCALGFATPLSVWALLGRLATRGLLARGGDAMERLARVNTVIFDKTGTLTDPDRESVVLEPIGCSRDELARFVVAVESETRHPLAETLLSVLPRGAARRDRLHVEELVILPGRGVEAKVREGSVTHQVRIGTFEVVEVAGDRNALERTAEQLGASAGSRLIAVTVDGTPKGLAIVDERVDARIGEAIAELGRLGIEVVLLTGDARERANRIGIEHTRCRQSPEDKRRHVAELRARGRRVLFAGDGLNDAAAMAESDVSIAVAAGADLPRDIADVIWHGRDVRGLPWAIGRARRTLRLIRSNLWLAASYNVVGISVAAAGLLHPVFAALLMLGSSLVVILRASVGGAAETDALWAEAVASYAPPPTANAVSAPPALPGRSPQRRHVVTRSVEDPSATKRPVSSKISPTT